MFKIVSAALLVLASLALAQQSGGPEQKPDVYLQNDRPKNEKESNTRTIEGTVKDAADNPLPNSIVQLKDTKTSKIVDFATKEDGKFVFRDLSMSINYELAAKHGDLTAPVKKVSIYDTRKNIILNFLMTADKQ